MSGAVPESPEFSIALVKEVEKYDELYNFLSLDYSNKIKTDIAWNKVGRKLNSTADLCKLRWKNIRNAYLRNLRQQPPTGTSGRNKKKAYYLHEYLAFLSPYTKGRKQTSNLDVPKDVQHNEEEMQEIDINYISNDLYDGVDDAATQEDSDAFASHVQELYSTPSG
ncbi:uncharacterized protein LOC129233632, partial [Uloborus diversus]